jgi:predicted nucleotidyltransferase
MIEVRTTEIAEICRRYALRELALFGSSLRDDFAADSDVDVLIEPGPGTPRGFAMLGSLQEELEAVFGRPVDLVTVGGLSPYLRDEILSTRRSIYVEA